MTIYQEMIAISRYSHWNEDLKRRESWEEVVNRYMDFIKSEVPKELPNNVASDIAEAIKSLEVMPSMRGLYSAGPGAKRCNVSFYNCSYLPIDSPRSFDETMYLLMSGTGVGFSVERQYINQLPKISEDFCKTDTTIVVADSTPGWCGAFRELISLLIAGQIPSWDVSRVRPKGARLKTKGGRASGPGPLVDLFNFTVKTFTNAAGRRLNSLECHDLICKVGQVIIAGGNRRSALISLSNLSDDRLREAKSGQWWLKNPHRSLANNSAAYTERPELLSFMKEWQALYQSKSGERGIFNREAAVRQVAATGRREPFEGAGVNPCGEIILRPFSFCNLSSVIVRDNDTFETLTEKVKLAAIIGTIQSCFVNFKYLRAKWRKNCEEERLLGISLNGALGILKLREKNPNILRDLKQIAIDTNKIWANYFGINQSVAVTTIKPEGNSSQLVGVSSGMHPWWSPFYNRTVRASMVDPIARLLKDQGVPCEIDLHNPNDAWVFTFPQKAPSNSIFRADLTALEHLEIWKIFKEEWCEHNPSVTINVKEHEWMEVAAWVWKNFDSICGISFLPYSDHTYEQAPYQELTENEYNDMIAKMPIIDWTKLSNYEVEDQTTGAQQYACTGDVCEIVELGNA